MPSWPSIAVIAYITLMPMALGNGVWFSIVRVLSANVAVLFSVVVQVVAMVCGAIVYQEPLGLMQLIAMVCCASGLLLALTQTGGGYGVRMELIESASRAACAMHNRP